MGTNELASRRSTSRSLVQTVGSIALALTIGAAAATLTGTTVGLMSRAAPSQGHGFNGGTVTLTNNVSGGCTLSNVLAGGTPSTCTLTTTYTGLVSTYLGLDVLIETQAGTGGTRLYLPSDSAHDLQIGVTSTSPTVTYTVPTTATACPGGAPGGSTCYELDKELVSTAPFTSTSAPVTFTALISLPAGSTSGYRGGAAQIYLTAHATQSGSNSPGSCTAGSVCPALTWS